MTNLQTIFKGLRFGMLLQLAVGPMCFMVLNISMRFGWGEGLLLVAAITLVDALYIALAGFGVAAMMDKKGVRQAIKVVGCAVLVLFGANIVLNALGVSLLPRISLFSGTKSGNTFIQGILLTASNPLTIAFWGGVFSAQVAANEYTRKQLVWFSGGCVLSTVLFLSAIAALGVLVGAFVSEAVGCILNIIVGVLLIFYGIRLVAKREPAADADY